MSQTKETPKRYLHTFNKSKMQITWKNLFMLEKYMTLGRFDNLAKHIQEYWQVNRSADEDLSQYKKGSELYNKFKLKNERRQKIKDLFNNRIEAITEFEYSIYNNSKITFTVYKIYDVEPIGDWFEEDPEPTDEFFIEVSGHSFAPELFFTLSEMRKTHFYITDVAKGSESDYMSDYFRNHNPWKKYSSLDPGQKAEREFTHHEWLMTPIWDWVKEGRTVTWYRNGNLVFIDELGEVVRELSWEKIYKTSVLIQSPEPLVFNKEGKALYYQSDPYANTYYTQFSVIRTENSKEPEEFFKDYWHWGAIQDIVEATINIAPDVLPSPYDPYIKS